MSRKSTKTSVRTSAKDTNKSSTGKARKGRAATTAAESVAAEAADVATTLATDAAAPTPAKGKAKRGKAAPAQPSPGAALTGEAFAEDGTKRVVSIPVDDDATPDANERVSLADHDRSKRSAAKSAKGAKLPRAPKPAKEPKVKKVSGLDAAAIVLAEAGAPMKTTDMLAEIQKRNLWTSTGATPAATLYAAIIREIAAKGELSRFKKHDRGLFVATFPVSKGA